MGILDNLIGGHKSIDEYVNRLPRRGPTVMALKALDYAVPDTWDNPTDFDKMIVDVTGDDDSKYLEAVKKRAIELYDDKKLGYRGARKLYATVDDTDKVVALAVAVEKFNILDFLDRLTPKPEASQAADLALKVVVELIAFTKINGLPGDSFGDFAAALKEYAGDARLRMAALVAYDGVLPLGPNCIDKVGDLLSGIASGEMGDNPLFRRIGRLIPGGDDDSKLGFVRKGFDSAGEWMGNMIRDQGLEQSKILDGVGKFIDIADDKVDYVGALIDATTNYMEHTGTQSVARSLIERASAEV